MIRSFFSILLAHRWVSIAGVAFGVAMSFVWLTCFVNLAPIDDKATSAGSMERENAELQRKARVLYQPRFESLLNRLQKHGRFGGNAWQRLREVVDSWLLTDPIACINHLTEKGAAGLLTDSILDGAIERVFHGNFSAAMKAADEIGDSRIRTRWIERAYALFAREHPKDALDALATLPKFLEWDLEYALMNTIAGERDPAEKMRTFLKSGRAANGYFAISMWAQRDPESAWTFLRGYLRSNSTMSDSRRFELLSRVLIQIGNKSPEKVFAACGELPPSVERTRFQLAYLRNLATKEPEKAFAMANATPGDIGRGAALKNVLNGLADKNSPLAKQIREILPSQPERPSFDLKNPAKDAGRAAAIQDPVARVDSMRNLAGRWWDKDSVQAADYAAEEAEVGNASWLRLMTDEMLRRMEKDGSNLSWVAKLSVPAQTALQTELEARGASSVRDRVMEELRSSMH